MILWIGRESCHGTCSSAVWDGTSVWYLFCVCINFFFYGRMKWIFSPENTTVHALLSGIDTPKIPCKNMATSKWGIERYYLFHSFDYWLYGSNTTLVEFSQLCCSIVAVLVDW